jgi:hypothetical protein
VAETVYILCAITSALCAGLLFRGYLRGRLPFLLWSSVCFVGLFANNVLLFVDKIVLPNTDLSFWRSLSAVLGFAMLLYGLIWDAE